MYTYMGDLCFDPLPVKYTEKTHQLRQFLADGFIAKVQKSCSSVAVME